jgi:hypothetical protein
MYFSFVYLKTLWFISVLLIKENKNEYKDKTIDRPQNAYKPFKIKFVSAIPHQGRESNL